MQVGVRQRRDLSAVGTFAARVAARAVAAAEILDIATATASALEPAVPVKSWAWLTRPASTDCVRCRFKSSCPVMSAKRILLLIFSYAGRSAPRQSSANPRNHREDHGPRRAALSWSAPAPQRKSAKLAPITAIFPVVFFMFSLFSNRFGPDDPHVSPAAGRPNRSPRPEWPPRSQAPRSHGRKRCTVRRGTACRRWFHRSSAGNRGITISPFVAAVTLC